MNEDSKNNASLKFPLKFDRILAYNDFCEFRLPVKNISTENFEAFKTDVKALNMEELFSRV